MNGLSAEVEELEYTRKKMEERTCCCGGPRGPQGIVEKVYRARKTGLLKCKVIMESGSVRYLDVLDVYAY
jgi:hypothetical protein